MDSEFKRVLIKVRYRNFIGTNSYKGVIIQKIKLYEKQRLIELLLDTRRNVMTGIAGNGCDILVPFNERKPIEEIENSLTTTYRSKIWSKFLKAIKQYELVKDGDKVAVGVSGGKDSMLMAKLFQRLQKNGQIKFELEFLLADPGYHPDVKS